MTPELSWNDLVEYFGDDLAIHRLPLSSAGWNTYGLLASRFVANDTLGLVNGEGEHAERKLVGSTLWTQDLDQALAAWHPNSSPMLVLLAINRSPCADCAHLLADALHRIHNKYPLTAEKHIFLLASLGYYHSSKDEKRAPGALPKSFTTERGLRALRDAGWRLCTLSFDGKLTRRGKEFGAQLERMSGRRSWGG